MDVLKTWIPALPLAGGLVLPCRRMPPKGSDLPDYNEAGDGGNKIMIRVHRIFRATEHDFSPEAPPVQPPIQGVVAPSHLGKI